MKNFTIRIDVKVLEAIKRLKGPYINISKYIRALVDQDIEKSEKDAA